MIRRALVIAFSLGACGGRYGGHATTEPVTKPAQQKTMGIEAAALPFSVVEARTGHQVDIPMFWSKVATARAVCVGEDHPNPHHHWVQLETVKQLAQRLPKGAKLAVGLEMVQKPFQGVLDDFAAKRIDEAALRSRTGWSDRWGYDYTLYGPTLVAAVAAGGQLLALNAADELRKKVSHKGLESLTPDERREVPELKLDDAAHRAWFDALMEGMGGSTAHSAKSDKDANPHDTKDDKEAKLPKGHPEMPSAERVYTVQVLWDETMADTAAKWLKANPTGHLVILAGNGHCHDSAIVNRIKRRGIADAISVHPVLDDGEGSVAEVLAKPMNDYVVILQMPPDVEKAHADK
jgi:uncharacterized iron-regulated protein